MSELLRIAKDSSVTLPELLGFVLYAFIGVFLVASPDSLSFLGFKATGLEQPFNVNPIYPGIFTIIGAHGWLLVTLYVEFSTSE